MRIALLTAAGIGLASLATVALPVGTATASDEMEDWQQATAVGEPTSCIPLRSIRNTEVRDDRTIDFHMSGGRTFRNTLPYECHGLGFDEAFSYRTSLSQLCSTDIITVLRQPISAGIPGPSCGLGRFQQVTLADD